MISLNQKGNVLLYAVIAMTAISVLGTGIYFLTSTSTFGGLRANQQNRAYQLALAGKDYALAKNLGNTAPLYPSGRDFTFTNGDKFRLVIVGDTITSTGIVNVNTPYEARRTITVTKTEFGSQAGISFTKDIAAMGVIQPTSAPVDFISKTASALSLGKIGASYQSQFGAVVYSGNAVQGNCGAGKCQFGSGFNAFFVFQFASGSTGDGFTFTFFNGNNNNSSSVGGYAGTGELLGYAGNSYVSGTYYLDGQGGRGIQPPKVAVEFDPYANSGTESVCGADSRYDASRNHMALVFWGDNTTFCGATVGKNTFDDNRHGAGTDPDPSGTNPMNAKSPIDPTLPPWSACNYFNGNTQCSGGALGWPTNWLLNAPNNVYAFRMEVRRSLTAVGGNYPYEIKAWIKPCGSGDLACSAYNDSSNFANPKVIRYQDSNPADIPTLNRTTETIPPTPILLNEANHQAFNTLLFGWTTATGGATQNVNITRFKMNFL
jgi:hypothetical protein